MHLETYRESGSFKHFGYQPERDRDFGGLYCAEATTDDGTSSVQPKGDNTLGGGGGVVEDPPTG